MMRWLLALAALIASPAAAQLNLPAQLTYSVTDPTPTYPVPADAEMPPAISETYDVSQLTTTTSTNFVASNYQGSQAKARFTCVPNDTVAYIDQLRGPGQQPFGHGHGPFFGGTSVSKDITTWPQLRAAAQAKSAAGVLAATCPGDRINGSLYWQPWVMKPNALGDGVTRLKKVNLITLYYVIDKPEAAATTERLRRGFGAVFGMNMDDPDMLAFKALIAKANQTNPQIQLQFNEVSHGEWVCDGDSNVYPALANYDGTPMFQCAAGKTLYARVSSNVCWNGHLRSADGYSHIIPQVRAGQDGQLHCPAEYPYKLPQIETIFRYSHLGPSDYSKWRLSSDDHAAMITGRAFRNGESLHTDYIFGWDERFSDDWQCALGMKVPGRLCTVAEGGTGPHDLDYSTTGPRGQNGPVTRLLSDSVVPNSGGKVLIDLGRNFTGAQASDWLDMPTLGTSQPVKGPVKIHVH
ncbi:DUF1996 domain-containing protein [Sphingomonas sp. MA1305]|nr:DUF1996 domain-containing protein [Sphingomonas sp. MA1305]